MNRARDYINFAVKFVGIGYVVLWPLTGTSATGDVFGAAFICGGRLGTAARHLCDLPHPLRLSLGLHAVGALFAVLALLHLAFLALRAKRRPRNDAAAPVAAPSIPSPASLAKPKKPRFHLRPLPPPRKPGRPRKEFGLRGVPR
jgi:hypothetical protein